MLECIIAVRLRQGLVCLHALQLDSTSEVACKHFRNFLLLLSCNRIYCGDTLLCPCFRVNEIHAFGHFPGHYLEVRNFAEMLFYRRPVEEQGDRAFGIALDLHSFGSHGGVFRRRWSDIDNELHQPLDTDILLARKREYRVYRTVQEPYLHSAVHFLFRELTGFEEFFHQGLVGLCRHFHQRCPHRLGLVDELRRYLDLFARAAVILESIGFHFQYVHESVEIRTDSQRELHYDRLASEILFHRIKSGFPVCLVRIELVHSYYHRFFVLVGVTCENLRTHFDSLLRIDEKHA